MDVTLVHHLHKSQVCKSLLKLGTAIGNERDRLVIKLK